MKILITTTKKPDTVTSSYTNYLLPPFDELVSIFIDLDLHPKGPIGYERNVLFIRKGYFDKIWGF